MGAFKEDGPSDYPEQELAEGEEENIEQSVTDFGEGVEVFDETISDQTSLNDLCGVVTKVEGTAVVTDIDGNVK